MSDEKTIREAIEYISINIPDGSVSTFMAKGLLKELYRNLERLNVLDEPFIIE